MGFLARIGVHVAGLSIGGALGLVSATITLYLLVDASINDPEGPVWLILCALIGLIVGALSYKIILWASKGSTLLR